MTDDHYRSEWVNVGTTRVSQYQMKQSPESHKTVVCVCVCVYVRAKQRV